jgi:hypothetical protein
MNRRNPGKIGGFGTIGTTDISCPVCRIETARERRRGKMRGRVFATLAERDGS